MSNSCFILVDFDNFIPKDFTVDTIDRVLRDVVNDIIRSGEEIDLIRIRLYGGWYQSYRITNRASLVASMLSMINHFPLYSGLNKIDGEIELASTLINDDTVWGETYEEKDGIPKIVIKSEFGEACERHGANCPLKVLQNLTKKASRRCEMDGCEIVHKEAIKRMGQKCVDSIIVCDIISLSEMDDCSWIVLLSDDKDLHPAFLASREKRESKRTDYYMTNHQRFDAYRGFLESFNVNCHLYEHSAI
ncbi:MAG: hypothetical protein J6U54_10820 [Clostridiales bacterium]|nr:hypothetical protein [Clostridiales bacterium]